MDDRPPETREARYDRLLKEWLASGSEREPDYDAVTLDGLCARAREKKEGR